MIGVFGETIFERRAHAHVVGDREVLNVLAQADAAACGQTGTPNFFARSRPPAPR